MKTILLCTVAILVSIAGCTTAPTETAAETEVQKQEKRAEKIARQGFEVGEQVDRINFPRFLDSWGYIDDQTIWLEARPSRYYLVTTSFPCPGLAFSQGIGLKSRTGSYLMELDDIIVDRQPARRCRIDSIYVMDRKRGKSTTE